MHLSGIWNSREIKVQPREGGMVVPRWHLERGGGVARRHLERGGHVALRGKTRPKVGTHSKTAGPDLQN